MNYSAESLVHERIGEYCAAIYAKGAPLDCMFALSTERWSGFLALKAKTRRRSKATHASACTSARTACTSLPPLSQMGYAYTSGRGGIWRVADTTALRSATASSRTSGVRVAPQMLGAICTATWAFGLPEFVMSGYKNQRGAGYTSYRRAFNKEMSSKRVVVKWTFGDLKANWAFINFPDKLKIGSCAPRCSSWTARTASEVRSRRASTFTSSHPRLSRSRP
jgi:hypothetical protein